MSLSASDPMAYEVKKCFLGPSYAYCCECYLGGTAEVCNAKLEARL